MRLIAQRERLLAEEKARHKEKQNESSRLSQRPQWTLPEPGARAYYPVTCIDLRFVAVFLKVIGFHCSRTGTGLSRFRNELSAGIGASRGKITVRLGRG
jgi:hypothetical protein